MTRAGLIGLAGALLGAAALSAQTPRSSDPTSFIAGAEVKHTIAEMEREMKPGQGFMWRPVVRADGAVAALEYWKVAGRPAVHPAEIEYASVIAGAGKLVSGGRLIGASSTKPGLIEGDRIEGGTTTRLGPGDIFLIPAGVPHWFEISGGKLVLLGTKLAQRGAGPSAPLASRTDKLRPSGVRLH